MLKLAEELRNIVTLCTPMLQSKSREEATRPPSPGKWSAIQIVGHLIDSASNNQYKFVHGMSSKKSECIAYQQNTWVDTQSHQTANWQTMVALWSAYNQHLAHVIEQVQPESHENQLTIGGAGPFTLAFIMRDYVEHTKHHLLQIDPTFPLDAAFKNVY